MKKISCLCIMLLFIFSGCGNKTVDNVESSFIDTVNNTKSYVIKGTMQIYSDEDTFTYAIEASFLKDNFYKVQMINQTNNHEQIILRNTDGIYVITPSLNKSFKFQSEWPDNSSQSYLLTSIAKDMENDESSTTEEVDGNYVVKTTVNYPNNPDLTYQKVYLDDDANIIKVEVYNDSDIVKIKVEFSSVDLKASLSEEDFKLEDYIQDTTTNSTCDDEGESCEDSTDSNTCEEDECEDEETSNLQDIIYPLFIPSNTYLSSSDKVSTDTGERVILTFGGEKNFILIEEPAVASTEFEIIPVYGDPLMLTDTIGALSANSLSWVSNNTSYYLTGTDLSQSELLTIAESLGVASTVSGTGGEK